MVTVVCLSPSLDQTIILPSLTVGGTNRVREKRTAAGGKGVNVAMTLAAMGAQVCLVTPRHAHGAQPLFEALAGAGIAYISEDTPGALRVNIKLMDASSDTITEVNAAAEPVPQAVLDRLEAAIAASAKASRWLVLTGSLPAGCAADIYARIIRRVRAQAPQCRIALDAEGEPLRLGVMEAPDFVKPNRHELELLMGRPLPTDADVLTAAGALTAAGVANVLVSLDKDGALLVSGDAAYRTQAVCVPVATTVGAGDALLSGYICAQGMQAQEAMAFGVACATARVAGRDGHAQDYLPLVRVQKTQ